MLAALPKSAHPGAKKALAEIWNAEDKRHALDAVTAFHAGYGAKFPKATAKFTEDVEEVANRKIRSSNSLNLAMRVHAFSAKGVYSPWLLASPWARAPR